MAPSSQTKEPPQNPGRFSQRVAVVMSLVQSARLNGLEPWAYLRDVLERLPTHLNSRIDDLPPHRWQSPRRPTMISSG